MHVAVAAVGRAGLFGGTCPGAVAVLVVVAPLLQDLVLALPILFPRRTGHSHPSLCWLRPPPEVVTAALSRTGEVCSGLQQALTLVQISSSLS